MITMRNGLKSLLAALSLTACATGHAQVLGGQLTNSGVVAGGLGGSLGSPAIHGALDGSMAGTLDADTTRLQRASERGVDSATSRTKRAKRTAAAEGEKPAKRSKAKHAELSQVTANSTAQASVE